jgi:hypothetical protein
MKDNYMIVRFYSQSGKAHKIIKKGLTEEQAKEHCNNPNTRKAGVWFDGFTCHDIIR